MYSWEIDEILKNNNYYISSTLYLDIVFGSPQLTNIIYKTYDESFVMVDNNGYMWKFQVFEGEKGNEK